ncbi:MAG TPA: hypothetical protein PK431_10710 [Chitinophagales bacterium]|nr:hypothetical protein [Chitinophagales bacterium]
MIDKNEKLFAGNYLMYHSDTDMICKLDATDVFNIATGYMENDKIHSPIPLTPELLIDCGFQKQNNAEWFFEYSNDDFIVVKQLLKIEVYLCFDRDIYIEVEQEQIHYLHQLQNLYYALTGTELIYTPKQ